MPRYATGRRIAPPPGWSSTLDAAIVARGSVIGLVGLRARAGSGRVARIGRVQVTGSGHYRLDLEGIGDRMADEVELVEEWPMA